MPGGGFVTFALGLGMIAALALIVGAGRMLVAGKDRQRATLMIVAALVLIANVLIWAWPIR